ncbi:MAG: hypothetical protein ACSW70_00420, partial [Eubacteriales bacterium]
GDVHFLALALHGIGQEYAERGHDAGGAAERPVRQGAVAGHAEAAVAEESIFEEAAPAAAAAAVAWPEEEPVVEEPVEEVVEREAEPEEDTYEVECPSCGHVMFIDDSILAQGGIECPKCHEKLEFEVEYED